MIRSKLYRGLRKKRSKFGNIPTIINRIRFASRAEGRRYRALLLYEKQKIIRNLELQPRFKFPCGITYVADFSYIRDEKIIVEDVKGMETKTFRMKKRMFELHYPMLELRVIK